MDADFDARMRESLRLAVARPSEAKSVGALV